MSDAVPGKEILEIAFELEKTGRKFYEHMATSANGAGETYQDMADQEKEHEGIMAYALDHLASSPTPEIYPSDYYEYVKGLSDRIISLDGTIQEAVAQGFITPEKTAEICMALERDSIFLYSTMYSLVSVPGREVCQKLAGEETLHLRELQRMMHERGVPAPSGDRTMLPALPVRAGSERR